MASLTAISGQLGIQKAAHFLRRTTFGATRAQIDDFATKTIDEALVILLAAQSKPSPPIDPKTGSTWLNPKPDPLTNSDEDLLIDYFLGWNIEQMRKAGTTISERMTYFYHTHLPVQRSIVRQSAEIYYQNALYRHYALGNFKTLITKTIIDNAMLRYIDNTLNEENSPNENFAREMLELYTIGKGLQVSASDYTNYTETDIQQAARVLTGFKCDEEFTTIDPDTNLPRAKLEMDATGHAYLHDAGEKTFTDKFANTTITPNDFLDGYATEAAVLDELNQLIDMIFAQPETAKFLCRKLYRQFVYYQITPEIETDIITPLAQTFMDNAYEIKPILEQLFSSEHFYDTDNALTPDNHVAAIIKSPVELIVGALRFFDVSMPSDLYENAYRQNILRWLSEQGQIFYEPIDVAGYPAYHQVPTYNRFWITPNTIAYRYQFAAELIKNTSIGINVVAYVADTAKISDASDARILLSELLTYLLPQAVPTERFDYFLSILLDSLTEDNWTTEWNAYVASNDDTSIRPQLEILFIAIMQSPEYQLI